MFLYNSDKCVCNEGYIGDGCAQRNDTPPLVIRPTDAFCDVRISPCTTVTVIGEGFIDSPHLVCYVKEVHGLFMCQFLIFVVEKLCILLCVSIMSLFYEYMYDHKG